MIRIGHEQLSIVNKAARKVGMSKSKLCSILAKDGAAKINAGTLAINTETLLIEKNA